VDSAEQHHAIQDSFKRPVRLRIAGFIRGNLGDGGLGDLTPCNETGLDPGHSNRFQLFRALGLRPNASTFWRLRVSFQWIAVVELKNYNEAQLAEAFAKRWSCENIHLYQMSRILVEKYDLVNGRAGGGGEYAVQVGFGWTNGVLRALASLYPTRSKFSPQLCEGV
jgi:hypothetical protein